MSEENFRTLWCKGRLTEADTPTIRVGATPSGLTSAHLHHPPIFLQAGCPSCRPTNSVKALKATSAFGLGRRRQRLLNGVTCTVSVPLKCPFNHLTFICTILLQTQRLQRDKEGTSVSLMVGWLVGVWRLFLYQRRKVRAGELSSYPVKEG